MAAASQPHVKLHSCQKEINFQIQYHGTCEDSPVRQALVVLMKVHSCVCVKSLFRQRLFFFFLVVTVAASMRGVDVVVKVSLCGSKSDCFPTADCREVRQSGEFIDPVHLTFSFFFLETSVKIPRTFKFRFV